MKPSDPSIPLISTAITPDLSPSSELPPPTPGWVKIALGDGTFDVIVNGDGWSAWDLGEIERMYRERLGPDARIVAKGTGEYPYL